MRQHKFLIAAVTLLTLGSALFFSFRQDPVYESTVQVVVKPLSAQDAFQSANYNFLVSMETEVAIAQSPAVAERAAGIVESSGGSPNETGTVSVRNPENTTFLDITYADDTAALAKTWAQAYGEGYMANRKEQATSEFQAAEAGLNRRMAELQRLIQAQEDIIAATKRPDEKKGARAEIERLEGLLAAQNAELSQVPSPAVNPAQIVDPADLPSEPASPNHVQNGLLGLLAGLALGIGIAFVRDRMDDRLASRRDLEEQLGAPTLAIVPRVRNWRRRKSAKLVAVDSPTSAAAEAYRAIRANLEFIGRDGEVKVITVTSPALGEGKTTTVADLAVTLAKAGKRVIAVSCDLRKPRLHAFFALSNEVGLVDLLRGGERFAEATQQVMGIDSLRVIPSGQAPHNPAELLGSETMTKLLEALRAHADYVLLDTPPVLAVADALLLAPRTDGVIVIADAGTTTRSALAATRQELEQVGAKVLGGVLNNLDPKRARSYPSYVRDYYGYGYGRYTSKGRSSENGHKGTTIDLEQQKHLWK